VPGTINITWAKRVFKREAAIAEFSGPVMAAAEEIAALISAS
jgi:hypothetical protein